MPGVLLEEEYGADATYIRERKNVEYAKLIAEWGIKTTGMYNMLRAKSVRYRIVTTASMKAVQMIAHAINASWQVRDIVAGASHHEKLLILRDKVYVDDHVWPDDCGFQVFAHTDVDGVRQWLTTQSS